MIRQGNPSKVIAKQLRLVINERCKEFLKGDYSDDTEVSGENSGEDSGEDSGKDLGGDSTKLELARTAPPAGAPGGKRGSPRALENQSNQIQSSTVHMLRCRVLPKL